MNWLLVVKVVLAIAAIIMAANAIYGASTATRGAIQTWTTPREVKSKPSQDHD
jgi:K+ transporter